MRASFFMLAGDHRSPVHLQSQSLILSIVNFDVHGKNSKTSMYMYNIIVLFGFLFNGSNKLIEL